MKKTLRPPPGPFSWLMAGLVLIGTANLAGGPQAGSPRRTGAAETRLEAVRFRQKLVAIVERADRPAKARVATPITDRELNAYFAHEGAADLPVGLAGPHVVFHGARRVSGSALVDLDAVRAQHKSRGVFDPVNYLVGKLPVTASGLLEAREGVARFQLESATISGVPVPKMILQEVVAYYTRSPEYPKGVDIDGPFPLPARIREIELRRGEALVVQ